MAQTLLPEWSPVKAVLLAWPFPSGIWKNNYSQVVACYWDMLSALSKVVPVWLLYHPELDLAEFARDIVARDVDSERVTIIHSVIYNDTWIRDYGPLSLSRSYITFTFNAWGGKYPADRDNSVPQNLSSWLGQEPRPISFVCEGGALETNGVDLLANDNCVVDEFRNPGLSKVEVENTLKNELGLRRILWINKIVLSGDDTDGHIDTIVRFANSTTLLYSGRNQAHPDALILQNLHNQVQKIVNDLSWRAFELPSASYKSLVNGRSLPCTYANFLIVNGYVFVPTYGLPEDSRALEVMRLAFPNYDLIPVRCEALLEQHGSLHCSTMQIADIDLIK